MCAREVVEKKRRFVHFLREGRALCGKSVVIMVQDKERTTVRADLVTCPGCSRLLVKEWNSAGDVRGEGRV